RGFLQKAVRPRKIATLIRNFSESAGDLGISWRQFARFLCVSESFLLVLKRSGIELRKPGCGLAQLGIEFQRLLEGRSRLVRRTLLFVSVSQAHLGNNIVRLLFRHRLEL